MGLGLVLGSGNVEGESRVRVRVRVRVGVGANQPVGGRERAKREGPRVGLRRVEPVLGQGQRAPGVDPPHARLCPVDGERGEISHGEIRRVARARHLARRRVRARFRARVRVWG